MGNSVVYFSVYLSLSPYISPLFSGVQVISMRLSAFVLVCLDNISVRDMGTDLEKLDTSG